MRATKRALKEWAARPNAYRKEVERLFLLSDRWLGQELGNLLDKALEEDETLDTWEVEAIWAIATRLGAKLPPPRVSPITRDLDELVNLSPTEFRKEVSDDLMCPLLPLYDQVDPQTDDAPLSALALLCADPLLGNPACFALDRICPPPAPGDDEDSLSREMRELSRVFCNEEAAAWSPKMRLLDPAEVDKDMENALYDEILSDERDPLKDEKRPYTETKQDPKKLAELRDEVARLHGLPDRWLGEEVMKLARLLTHDFSREGGMFGIGRNPMVTEAIPEIARRLGAKLHGLEQMETFFTDLSAERLRVQIGDLHATQTHMPTLNGTISPEERRALDLFNRDHLHGNPIIIALDRVCPRPPAGAEGYDWLAWDARTRSKVYYTEQFDSWSPDIAPRAPEDISIEEERSLIDASWEYLEIVCLVRGAAKGVPIGPRTPFPEMNMKALSSDERRAKRDAADLEVRRLFELHDLDLAKELMRISKEAYRENYHLFDHFSRRRSLIVHTLREVVRRLALKVADTPDRGDEAKLFLEKIVTLPHMAEEGDLAFRYRAGSALVISPMNDEYKYYHPGFRLDPTSATGLLARELREGNPIAIAIDRICPPAQEGGDKRDPLACHSRMIGSHYTTEPFAQWTPDVTIKEADIEDLMDWDAQWAAISQRHKQFDEYCDRCHADTIATVS